MNHILFFFLFPFMVMAQEYEKHEYSSPSGLLPYRVLLPEKYNPKKSYPLLIFLHGAGERGSDNSLQLVHGSSLFLDSKTRTKYPMIVAFPQCPKESYWAKVAGYRPFRFFKETPENSQLDLLEEWMGWMVKNYPIASKEIYVGGLSMGGMGTLELLHRNPKKFAAAFAICGGADPSWSETIQQTPLWLKKKKKDEVVSYKFSADLYQELKKKGAPVRFTSYPDYNHNSWDAAFQEPDFLSWLLNHKRN